MENFTVGDKVVWRTEFDDSDAHIGAKYGINIFKNTVGAGPFEVVSVEFPEYADPSHPQIIKIAEDTDEYCGVFFKKYD